MALRRIRLRRAPATPALPTTGLRAAGISRRFSSAFYVQPLCILGVRVNRHAAWMPNANGISDLLAGSASSPKADPHTGRDANWQSDGHS